MPIEELRRAAGAARIALVESVAPDGSGVREAFVFAIRLALDRVRELQRAGDPSAGALEISGADLLDQVCALDGEEEQPSGGRTEEPDEPDEPASTLRFSGTSSNGWADEVPSGWVWPPVEGRIVLREALAGVGDIDPSDDFSLELPSGYRLTSSRAARFDSAERGHRTLIGWARIHSGSSGILSRGRCIVLKRTSSDYYRLWQIVRIEPTLRDLFIDDGAPIRGASPDRSSEMAMRLLAEAQSALREHAAGFDCDLDSVGLSEGGRPIFVGDVPLPTEGRNPSLDHWSMSE